MRRYFDYTLVNHHWILIASVSSLFHNLKQIATCLVQSKFEYPLDIQNRWWLLFSLSRQNSMPSFRYSRSLKHMKLCWAQRGRLSKSDYSSLHYPYRSLTLWFSTKGLILFLPKVGEVTVQSRVQNSLHLRKLIVESCRLGTLYTLVVPLVRCGKYRSWDWAAPLQEN